ncbi:flagellar protein FlaG [Paraglaciecola arctica]|uniref:Flagellar protein FlaG n=1 Tax=Paraglaciecola arctica BSs20135 TaxID=493475 RepID=K6XJM5_9ALTE|nr:flagellar protein FlaG [Paraglaciecola arctica]GAC20844.1 flagellar protein FlaG [Paraglaciecola arctica BSs20135]
MEINASQVGQNFALQKVDVAPESIRGNRTTENISEAGQQQAKDLSVSAEIEEQESIDVSAEQIENAVSQLSEFVKNNSRQLNFSVDEGSNKQVVKVTDSESGKIIRQIPTEEVLKLSERLQDLQTEVGTAVGLLFNKQV